MVPAFENPLAYCTRHPWTPRVCSNAAMSENVVIL
jgi:hypothetical protein